MKEIERNFLPFIRVNDDEQHEHTLLCSARHIDMHNYLIQLMTLCFAIEYVDY